MKKMWILPALGAALLAGCADPNTTYGANQHKVIAATTGAVVGGVLGHQMDDDRGRYVGAAVGALAGAALGHQMDNTQNTTQYYRNQNQQRQQYQQPQYQQPQYQQGYYQQPQYQQQPNYWR
ncbi:MAG: glycine zipper 2TM domain-containing protein [Cardiobacteriaceae bacterium]|nr:glycine zipper 2TM domain-containing protein [Cardiobacteriaceae bacterium]